ncbi:hypothetical protein [Rufibacter sp. XAAS-G3-1]|uniref:hypothetical protein n=1 Tax=Rufibacter sp. XAAS-G3-1 TaxID=2729134 RepID=UPI0015E70833|nr:hypothetical protein [Rufibacter sp. XAAS-G3-1]
MKKFFSLTCLAFASMFLLSCEKEEVEPNLSETTFSDKRGAACKNYSYFNKASGTVQYGKARSEMLLVGFADGMSLKARRQVIGRFPQFKAIYSEITMDSGVITVISLYPGSTCSDVEKLMAKLLKEHTVSFAYPYFGEEPTNPDVMWVGLTNEFMVSIEGSGTYAQLKQLMAKTRTKLVFSFDENIHVLSADKNSIGNVLDVLTVFNKQPYITVAEPNVVFYFTSSGIEPQATGAKTAKALGVGSFKPLKQANALQK